MKKSLVETFKSWWKDLMAFVFPSRCGFCQNNLPWGEYYICQDCWRKIDYILPPYCPHCGFPQLEAGLICPHCEGKDYYFNGARSVGWYGGVLKAAINLYKYEKKLRLNEPLGYLLINYWETKRRDYPADVIIPVPLYWRKKREREFNQSELLALRIGRNFKIPVSSHNLVRVSYHRPQVGLSARERWENIRGMFRVKSPRELKDKNILLIDDVYTTGATSNECSRILREGGAKNIWVLTLARG